MKSNVLLLPPSVRPTRTKSIDVAGMVITLTLHAWRESDEFAIADLSAQLAAAYVPNDKGEAEEMLPPMAGGHVIVPNRASCGFVATVIQLEEPDGEPYTAAELFAMLEHDDVAVWLKVFVAEAMAGFQEKKNPLAIAPKKGGLPSSNTACSGESAIQE